MVKCTLPVKYLQLHSQLKFSRQRYDSTTLHTTRVFSGLPYYLFPVEYPQYVPAKLIAQHYKKYVQYLGIPAYVGREVVSAVWDGEKKHWSVTVSTSEGIETSIAKILVFAVGIGGRWPIIPEYPGK